MDGALGSLGFDPLTQGLLSAAFRGMQMSGPSIGKPVSLGQIIGGAGDAGMGAYNSAQKTMLDEAYRRRLMEMEQAKTDLVKLQVEQARRKDQLLMGLLSGVPGGAGGVPSGAVPGGAAPRGIPGFLGSPQSAIAAQALGLPGAVDMYKHLDTPHKLEPGSTYQDRRTGTERFMPKVDVGMVPTAGGGIGVAPGALPTIGALKGAEEDAKASRDVIEVPQDNGTSRKMTRSEFISSQRPVATSGNGFPRETREDAVSAARKAIGMIESEMEATDDPGQKASLKKEADTLRKRFMLGSGSGPTLGVTQDPGKAAAVKESGQLDAKRADEYRSKMPSLASTRVNLDRLSELNADEKTYASAGAEFKKDLGRIAQAVGIKLNEKETANTELYIARLAELVKDRLASKDFGSGASVSNLDLMFQDRPLPEVAKTRAGRQQIIDALKKDVERSYGDMRSAVDHFDENKGFSGFRFPSESVVSPKSIPKTPANGKIKFMGFE